VSRKIAVQINGCFWHHHDNCNNATYPKTNADFWKAKIDDNVRRDKQNNLLLANMGWRTVTMWECEINKSLDSSLISLVRLLK